MTPSNRHPMQKKESCPVNVARRSVGFPGGGAGAGGGGGGGRDRACGRAGRWSSRPSLGLVALVVLSGIVACSSDEKKAPTLADPGGQAGTSGVSVGYAGQAGQAGRGGAAVAGSAGTGSAGTGGASAGAGGGGAGGTAGVGGDAAAGAGGDPPPEPFEEDPGKPPVPPDLGPPACDPGTSFGAPTPLLATKKGTLAAVTPDGLVVAFVGEADGAGQQGKVLYYAERATVAAAFGAPRQVQFAPAYRGTRPALSPDGKTLIVPRADGTALGLVRRAARADAFATAVDEAPFANVNVAAKMAARLLLDPAYSVDGSALLFTKLGPAGGAIASADEKANGTFAETAELTTFPATDSLIPTGLSADGRTLFVYAETAKEARALLRPAPGFAFDTVRKLGDKPYAQINATCDRLVFSSVFAGVGDLLVSEKQ
jgi:hypothetical protein